MRVLIVLFTVEEFFGVLCALSAEHDFITEAVHGATKTTDSRHFAEEFVRRKKMADKGVVVLQDHVKSSGSPADGGKSGGVGGWSEVAKKGPSKVEAGGAVKEEVGNGNFKVVPGKKKGGKK